MDRDTDGRCNREFETKYIGIIENLPKEEIWYIELWWNVSKDGNKFNERLVAADDCFIVKHRHKTDDCFSLDENLQNFVEKAGLLTEN